MYMRKYDPLNISQDLFTVIRFFMGEKDLYDVHL